jgi:L-amino acid N-acyltransferase YncA
MINVRLATKADAPALVEIYRPYVECTAVSFESECPTVSEFGERITNVLGRWVWLVAEEGGLCVGYAYASSHRERPAYRWSVEGSAYVREGHQRRGIGRRLYVELLEHLRTKGYCNVFAGVALPNEASIGLHESLGFKPIGVFSRVGRKFGAWHDVAWFQLQLLEEPASE